MTAAAATTPLLIERAKELIMDWVIKDDNVTFAELEYAFDGEKLREEQIPEDDQNSVRLWEIWANDENLILWETTNLLLVKAWNELAEAKQFDVMCIGNEKAAIYAYGNISNCRIPPYPFAGKNILKRLEDPNHQPLEKKYWQPVLLCSLPKSDNNKKKSRGGGA